MIKMNKKELLQILKEVIEEKINKEEDRLEQVDLTLSCDSMSYNYHLGKLSALREVESLVKDLLDE